MGPAGDGVGGRAMSGGQPMNGDGRVSGNRGWSGCVGDVDRDHRCFDPLGEPAPFLSAVGRRMGHFVLEAFLEGSRDAAAFRARRVLGPGDEVVAVKLLRNGVPSPEVSRVFEEETRSLAVLDHPAIPRLLGSGITPDGWAWFATEHVLGRSIIQHADHERLDSAGRVRLMVQVCRAVQHAHDRSVVHPELRPTSLMVTTLGEPKILGFGCTGLDWRKNVAELGAVLRRLVRVPSAVPPASPHPQHPGPDLARVCLKAVGHGPGGGYGAVGDLADDLERVLTGEPVSAGRKPLAPKIRRVLRRVIKLRAPAGSPPCGQRARPGEQERP